MEKDKKENLKTPNDLFEVLQLCGAIGYSDAQISVILTRDYPPEKIKDILSAINTPGTEEWKNYNFGATAGEFNLAFKLLQNAGESKDMYEAYSTEMRRRAINVALEEKFGI
ncbi:MAG: hypothetical protein LBP56_05175 [Odoribacteraceae bacterium]|jgi:hypothetical protein|nr:hypothetical protein [Odoribacteraceae bacterium]